MDTVGFVLTPVFTEHLINVGLIYKPRPPSVKPINHWKSLVVLNKSQMLHISGSELGATLNKLVSGCIRGFSPRWEASRRLCTITWLTPLVRLPLICSQITNLSCSFVVFLVNQLPQRLSWTFPINKDLRRRAEQFTVTDTRRLSLTNCNYRFPTDLLPSERGNRNRDTRGDKDFRSLSLSLSDDSWCRAAGTRNRQQETLRW